MLAYPVQRRRGTTPIAAHRAFVEFHSLLRWTSRCLLRPRHIELGLADSTIVLRHARFARNVVTG
jgi:hypothetical protein